MRELTVYYCAKCGYYAYYQLPRNAVCPEGHGSMEKLDLPLTSFMDLSCEKRDRLIAWHMMQKTPCLKAIAGSLEKFDCQEAMKQIEDRIKELEQDNSKLKDTQEWMGKMLHDLERPGHNEN